MIRGLVHETTQYSPRFRPGGIDLHEHVAVAAATGYGAIAFDRWSVAAHVGAGRRLAPLADAVAAAGLEVAALCTFRVTDGPSTRADAEDLLPMVEALRPGVVITVFRAPPTPAGCREVERLAHRLSPLEVRLGVEFIPHGHVPDLTVARRLVGSLDAPVGLVVDSWHVCRGPDRWAELAAVPAAEVAYVQVDDALPPVTDDPAHETVHRRTVPGEGTLDLARFCAALSACGYAGWVGVEVLSEALRDEPLAAVALRLHRVTERIMAIRF